MVPTWSQARGVFARSTTQPRRLVFSLRRDGARHGSATAGGDDRSGASEGNRFLLSGATIATLLMLGGLHAKRLYDDQKTEQARQRGIEPEFEPDLKAAFLQILPLRLISRVFGMLTSVEIPIWARPYVYRGYCQAFHANLEEVGKDLENYASLQQFFMRSLKKGCRPIDPNSSCLVSPVDGVMLRCGQIREHGLAIEQVKGHSYSLKSLLGEEPRVLASSDSETAAEDVANHVKRIHAELPGNDLFYCVLYLGPGDYHRVHSPTDWQVFYRRHFSGRLFPVNERAARTIRNLYIGNERVVLEGTWSKGFMALVAVGATNVGSIELKIEPDLKTNCQRPATRKSSLPSFYKYGKEGSGLFIQKGDEVATFNLGSTVVLVFQAPTSEGQDGERNADLQIDKFGFTFCVKRGDRVRMGQALGKWRD